MTPRSGGRLIIIGGGEQRDTPGTVLRTFVASLPDSRRVAVCGEASQTPDDMVELYRTALRTLECEVLPLTERDVHAGRSTAVLDRADALFLTGGSQVRLMERLDHGDFIEDLNARWQAGLVVAGTSAGASAIGRHMIESGQANAKPSDTDIEIGTGLGLIDIIIDQHFAERGRINRLLAAVARTGCLGVGIDEDTALVVDSRRGDVTGEVVGEGAITVIDGTTTAFHTRPANDVGPERLTADHAVVHVLEPGDRFDLAARRVIADDH